MLRKFFVCLAPIVLLFFSTTGFAQESYDTGGYRWLASAGITFGGDDLASAESNDGDYKDDVEAGGLFYIGAGGEYRFPDSPYAIEGIIGYHFDYVDADDGDATFSRWFTDLVGCYYIGKHRLGLGVTQHFNTKFDIDAPFYDGNIDFDNATGFIVEYAYMPSPNVGVSVRYTDIDYESDELVDSTIDGSNIGLFIKGYF